MGVGLMIHALTGYALQVAGANRGHIRSVPSELQR